MDESNTVTLIQCVASKADNAMPAEDIYQGTYFEAMFGYAEAAPRPYYILSAKYGLLDPKKVIEPYDEFGISTKQAWEIVENLDDMGIETVYVTAGAQYTDPLTPELERVGIDVVEIGRGMRIGERISHLQTKTKELKNGQLC